MPIAARMTTAPKAPMVRESFDPLALGTGEVVVEVAGCGVCHNDLGYLQCPPIHR